MGNSYTTLLSDSQAARLKVLLEARGYEPIKTAYSLFSFRGPKVVATVYEKKNKLLLQGAGVKEFIEFILEPEVLGQCLFGGMDSSKEAEAEPFKPHFGIDESGKGDYFGPLVIAGVYADAAIASALLKLGVCDSKLISSAAKVRSLSESIRKVPGIAYEVVRIGPERYNEMYAKIGNLNKLLAWGHARVIEVLMQKVPGCKDALSDQFAKEFVLKQAIGVKKLDIRLKQRTKAESDVVVAAASILARERFVDWMDECSSKGGIKLPLGASRAVVAAGREVVREYGEEMLPKVAKMHFKTTAEVLGVAK